MSLAVKTGSARALIGGSGANGLIAMGTVILKKTLWSVHFGFVVVKLINCKRGGIIRNELW